MIYYKIVDDLLIYQLFFGHNSKLFEVLGNLGYRNRTRSSMVEEGEASSKLHKA